MCFGKKSSNPAPAPTPAPVTPQPNANATADNSNDVTAQQRQVAMTQPKEQSFGSELGNGSTPTMGGY